jgi:hypothetical protein
MKIRSISLLTITALGVAALAAAQNPRGSASTSLDGKKVTVDYGRPALKGRSLDELMKQLPADRMWRAGENQVTTFATEGDLTIGGTKIPAGKYSLYVHAGENGEWRLVLNRDLGVALGQIWAQAPENLKNEPWPHIDGYTKAIGDKEVVRAAMQKAVAKEPADLFTMSFAPGGMGADLTLAWGSQAWSVQLQPAK